MSPKRSTKKGELPLIARVADLLSSSESATANFGPIGFGDDMAGIPGTAGGLFWTTDMLMDGVDFRSGEHSWREIGWKAMAVNLSDCAAMAVRPVGALCAVALSDAMSLDDAVELHRGVIACGEKYGCPLVGGDTNSWSQPTAVTITVAGRAFDDFRPISRSGARPGDRVFITGRLGGSILGRHMHPIPRIELAEQISRQLSPTAAIDISDGLATDLSHIVAASKCSATLDETLVENAIHADAIQLGKQDGRTAFDHTLNDGEDFELIVTIPANVAETHRATVATLGLIELGEIEPGDGIQMRQRSGALVPVIPRGWEHFR